ncbi:MAG: serine--tRNA ligase [Oscillospiraceae bacterium]|nr:serine--tRNA ligase [Oscillospiraceae bacterium]
MIDIKLLRNDPQAVVGALKNRGADYKKEIDGILEFDRLRLDALQRAETKKHEQNKASKEIPKIKSSGGDTSEIMERMKSLSSEIKQLDDEIRRLDAMQNEILLVIPNIPDPSVPVGADENDNPVIRSFMEPTVFDFQPKSHWELGAELGILDPETAAKVTGARFHFYKGQGARLERAVINFFLDTHTKEGYTEVFPPFIVNRQSMTGTGQLPKFEEDAFKLEGGDYFLVPTAEVPITNMHRNEILPADRLPLSYCAYSACFRAEAGSAGRDTRGLIRQHQFNKVELVKFSRPEDAADQLEKLTADAERVLRLLELPYRVVTLCTGDMGFSSAKTYDIEVYMPSCNGYREISSCSCFTDFQARRANIRYKESINDKAQLVYTLNGSGLAVGRTVAAIIENFQNQDGSITIPKALAGYMEEESIDS